jgi:hypothetical protein
MIPSASSITTSSGTSTFGTSISGTSTSGISNSNSGTSDCGCNVKNYGTTRTNGTSTNGTRTNGTSTNGTTTNGTTSINGTASKGIIPNSGDKFMIQNSGTTRVMFTEPGNTTVYALPLNNTSTTKYPNFTFVNNFLHVTDPATLQDACVGYNKPRPGTTCSNSLTYSSFLCNKENGAYNTFKYNVNNKTWCLNNDDLPAYCLTAYDTVNSRNGVFLSKLGSSGPIDPQIWDNILI